MPLDIISLLTTTQELNDMQNATHNALLDLIEDGVIDPMTVVRVALQWMGDDEVERMVNECPDFEGTGLPDDEQDAEDEDDDI